MTSSSVLVTDRSGAAVTGVVSVPVLFPAVGSGPFAPSSAATAVLASWVTPAGSDGSTVTAKTTVPVAPPATVPTVNVHVEATQLQPAVDAAASYVAWAGTVSVSTTPVAAWSPVLA